MARGTGAARAWHPGPGSATAPPEAPRGLLYQRYRIDAAGIILDARIVPPTSQNQRAIEHDLVAAVQANLALDDSVLGRLSEQTNATTTRVSPAPVGRDAVDRVEVG